ncbi:MAG: amidohydrolase [Chloroflexi bacterium]|nr:amidohydrolase [Chloroflexota bacterium]
MPALRARDLAPDLVLFNGAITTFDHGMPRCSAIACKDGRIVAIGDDPDVRALAGSRTEQIDLAGRTVVPGFNDAHNHMLEVGIKFTRLQVEHCTSIAEMVGMVREKAAMTPPGEWIIGEGWNESLFAEGRLPNRLDLDAATTQHPVLLKRFFNMDVVNSRALELGGVNAATRDPQGGKIERFADGTPGGILRAAAKLFCRRLIADPAPEQAVDALESAGKAYLAVGITSILDPGLRPWEMQAYQHARRAGKLLVRANLMPSWHGFREDETREQLDARAAELGVYSGLGDTWLSLGGLKMAVDGGTTSHTAWMWQPFIGEDKVHDYNRLDPEDLREFFARGHALGWDIGIHAIGDRAHHESAVAFAEIIEASPRKDHRHNLIHAYFASEESLQHMAKHQIAAVIQPTFIYFEGDDLFRDVGERLAHQYKPMRTYLDRGIPVIATSDIPSTVHYNPMIGLYSLVTRKTWKGTLIAPQEAVTREEALYAYTVAGAWLTREEQIKGPLSPGFLADMVVLDRDYFTCPVEEIKDIAVDMTVIDGRVAYRRDHR